MLASAQVIVPSMDTVNKPQGVANEVALVGTVREEDPGKSELSVLVFCSVGRFVDRAALEQAALEAYDKRQCFAVGLGAVGAGVLGLDAQLLTGGLPGLGAVGRTVVGQDSLHLDSSGAEP